MRGAGQTLPFLPASDSNGGEPALGLQGLAVARVLLPWGFALSWLRLLPGCTGFCIFAFAKLRQGLLVTQQIWEDRSPCYPWLVDMPVEIGSMDTGFFLLGFTNLSLNQLSAHMQG